MRMIAIIAIIVSLFLYQAYAAGPAMPSTQSPTQSPTGDRLTSAAASANVPVDDSSNVPLNDSVTDIAPVEG